MNKALLLIVLLAVRVSCSTLPMPTDSKIPGLSADGKISELSSKVLDKEIDDAAFKKVDDLLNKATTEIPKAADKASVTLAETGEDLNALGVQANITAQQLASALQQVRNTAFAKLEKIDELLNKTSATERAVIEKAFTVIDKIVAEVNKFTGKEYKNEYEAAEVSEYIQARISEARNLLDDVRKYITNFVDTATDQINRVVPPVIGTINVLSGVVTETSKDLKSIAELFNKQKQLYEQRALAAEQAKLPNIEGTEAANRKVTFDDLLKAMKQYSEGASIDQVAESLPESTAKRTIQNILDTAQTAKQVVGIGIDTYGRLADAYKTIKSGDYSTTDSSLNSLKTASGTLVDAFSGLKGIF